MQTLTQLVQCWPDLAFPAGSQVVVALLVGDHTSRAFSDLRVLPPGFSLNAIGRCGKSLRVPPLLPLSFLPPFTSKCCF